MDRFVGYRRLLQNRRFVVYESSAIAASVGYSVYAISVPWLAFRFSGSLLLVGLVLFVEFGVYTLTFLVAPWVDAARDKRTVFLPCYPAQAAAAMVLGLAMSERFLSVGLLLALVAFISFLWDFAWAAMNIAPRLLISKDELYRAQGFTGLLGGIAQLAGYSAGGVLIVVVGPAGGMYLYAGLLALGAGLVASVALVSQDRGNWSAYWREFRAGWRFFRRGVPGSLLPLGFTEVVRGFFAAAPALLITSITVAYAAGDPSGYASLYATWVVGSVIAGLALGELNPRGRVGRVLTLAAFVDAAGFLLAVLLAPAAFHGAYVWFLIGAAGTAYLVSIATFVQGAVPAGSIGRVSSNLYLFTGIGSSAGALVLGVLVSRWSPLDFGVIVALGLAAVGLMVGVMPSTRRLRF